MTSHVLENVNEAISNNYSSYHKAVDIVGNNNTVDDVVAISDGKVEMVVKNVKYTNHNTKGTATYGNFVKLKHENGQKSLYAHLKYGSVDVSNGQAVSKGEKIGTMGQTGNAYGTHLHFEVRNADESRENPNDYLNGTKTLDTKKEEPKEEIKQIIKDENENKAEIKEEINSNPKAIIENENTTNEINYQNNNLTTNNSNISNNNTSITPNETTLENKNYQGGSIVDGLKTINIDSSYDNRCQLALKNGIENYHGTYNQNVYLLKLLKLGKLKS